MSEENRCINCGKTFGEHFCMRCQSGSDASIWETQKKAEPPTSALKEIDRMVGEYCLKKDVLKRIGMR